MAYRSFQGSLIQWFSWTFSEVQHLSPLFSTTLLPVFSALLFLHSRDFPRDALGTGTITGLKLLPRFYKEKSWIRFPGFTTFQNCLTVHLIVQYSVKNWQILMISCISIFLPQSQKAVVRFPFSRWTLPCCFLPMPWPSISNSRS